MPWHPRHLPLRCVSRPSNGRLSAGRHAPASPARPTRIRGTTAGRADPRPLLEGQAESRVPELVPIRHGRMASSPFAYYRGAALPDGCRPGTNAQVRASGCRPAATPTCSTSASTTRPSARSSSTSTTSTRRCPARGSGTSSVSPRAWSSRGGSAGSAEKQRAAAVLSGVGALPQGDGGVRRRCRRSTSGTHGSAPTSIAKRLDDDRLGAHERAHRPARSGAAGQGGDAHEPAGRLGAHPRRRRPARLHLPAAARRAPREPAAGAERERLEELAGELLTGYLTQRFHRAALAAEAVRDRRHGAQGGRRRERRHPVLDHPADRP